jgi:holliday junction DNA helicase RuvB
MILLVFLIAIPFCIFYIYKESVKFVVKPLAETEGIEQDTTINTDENNPLKVIIKDNNINSERIIEYTGEELKSFNWYPSNFKEFIGQEEAKEQIKIIMKKAEKGIKAHAILSAIQGHGKTTLLRLLAKQLGARLIERIGKQLDADTIVDIVNEITTSKEKHVIFFLDEIDTADWKNLKLLNPIIQDFKLCDKRIKPFIFAGATINKDLLIKQVPDLLDRIPHSLQFKRYTNEELEQIISQYVNQLYNNEEIPKEAIKAMAQNCKLNPRLALGLIEDYIITKDINKTLKNRRIQKNGLTDIDIKILEILNEATRPMGANAVAMRIGLSQSQYEREYEPFLYEMKYIARTPSRIIDKKGRELLEELK